MTLLITVPLTDEQAKACVIAADRLGVEPWELAAFALKWRDDMRRERKD